MSVMSLRGKLFALVGYWVRSADGKLKKSKGKKGALCECFNIARIEDVKYNGRCKHPRNACSVFTIRAEEDTELKRETEKKRNVKGCE